MGRPKGSTNGAKRKDVSSHSPNRPWNTMCRPKGSTDWDKWKLAKDPNKPKRPTSAYFPEKREEQKKAGRKITRIWARNWNDYKKLVVGILHSLCRGLFSVVDNIILGMRTWIRRWFWALISLRTWPGLVSARRGLWPECLFESDIGNIWTVVGPVKFELLTYDLSLWGRKIK